MLRIYTVWARRHHNERIVLLIHILNGLLVISKVPNSCQKLLLILQLALSQHGLIQGILRHVVIFWRRESSSRHIVVPIREPSSLGRAFHLSVLNDLLVIPEAHVAIPGTMLIVFQLNGYSLVLAEWMSFLNSLGHRKSCWRQDLRLGLRHSTHLRGVLVLLLQLLLVIWRLSSPVSREYRPIIVLSRPCHQNLSSLYVLLLIIWWKVLV